MLVVCILFGICPQCAQVVGIVGSALIVMSGRGISALGACCCFGGNKDSAVELAEYNCRNGSAIRDHAGFVSN